MKRKRYNEDFKKMIVELYQSGTNVKDLAREYGISDKTIYSWNHAYTPSKETGMTPAEIAALKKENTKLKDENDVLKKVLTIFADK